MSFNNRISNYLRGKLSSDEKVNFEKEMSKNSELREEVESQKRIETILGLMIEQDFRNQVNSLANEVDLSPPPKKLPWKLIISIILILIIFIAIFISFKKEKNSSPNGNKIELPIYADLNEFKKNATSIQQLGIEFYKSTPPIIGNDRSLTTDSIKAIDNYYSQAHSKFLSTEFETAANLFSRRENILDSRQKQEAIFYEALSYLGSNNLSEGKRILDSIAKDQELQISQRHKNQALKLLKELDRLKK